MRMCCVASGGYLAGAASPSRLTTPSLMPGERKGRECGEGECGAASRPEGRVWGKVGEGGWGIRLKREEEKQEKEEPVEARRWELRKEEHKGKKREEK